MIMGLTFVLWNTHQHLVTLYVPSVFKPDIVPLDFEVDDVK